MRQAMWKHFIESLGVWQLWFICSNEVFKSFSKRNGNQSSVFFSLPKSRYSELFSCLVGSDFVEPTTNVFIMFSAVIRNHSIHELGCGECEDAWPHGIDLIQICHKTKTTHKHKFFGLWLLYVALGKKDLNFKLFILWVNGTRAKRNKTSKARQKTQKENPFLPKLWNSFSLSLTVFWFEIIWFETKNILLSGFYVCFLLFKTKSFNGCLLPNR